MKKQRGCSEACWKLNKMKFLFFLSSIFIALNSHAQMIPLGHWQQTCHQRNMNEEFFTPQMVRYSETYFADDQCSQRLISFVSEGPYQLQNNKINFTFSKASVSVFAANVVANFNQRSVCGWTNWAIGSRSILNQMCDFFGLGRAFPTPKISQQKFGIFKIENSMLYFGQLTQDYDGSTDAKRPVQLNPRPYQYVN